MISRHIWVKLSNLTCFSMFYLWTASPNIAWLFYCSESSHLTGAPLPQGQGEEFGTLFMVVFIIFCRLYPHVLPVLFPCLKKLLASPDSWGNPKMFNCLAINWNQHSMLTGSFKQHERIYTIWGFWPNGWIIDSSDQKFALSGIYIHSHMCLYSLILHEGNPPKR